MVYQETSVNKERIHPNKYLNDYVTFYALQYLDESGILTALKERREIALGSKESVIQRGIMNHFVGLGVLERDGGTYRLIKELPKSEDVVRGKFFVEAVAIAQRKVSLNEGTSVRSLIDKDVPALLTGYSGQCLMAYSYRELLESLYAVDKGKKKAGRVQPDNALGSGKMIEQAAARIGGMIANFLLKNNIHDINILELGSGNAKVIVNIVKQSLEKGIHVSNVLPSDKDKATRGPAETTFKNEKVSEYFNWMPIDMGNYDDMKTAAEATQGKQVVIDIGYILHESKELAFSTLKNIKALFPNAILAICEVFRQDIITDMVQLWFRTIHDVSGQELFYYHEFMSAFDSIDFVEVDREVLNAPDNPDDPPLNAVLLFISKNQAARTKI